MKNKGFKKKFKENMEIMGGFVNKHLYQNIIMLGLIVLFEIIFIIYWLLSVHRYSITNVIYLSSYIFLLIISIIGIIFLILSKINKLSNFNLAILLHIYTFLLMVWGTTITLLDLRSNGSVVVHLTISMVLGGILVVSPVFYTFTTLSSLITIFIFNFINHYSFFDGASVYLNLGVFFIMVIFMSFRHYNVRLKDAKISEYLRKISYTDHLTGLGNETAYFEETDKINKILEHEDLKYAIVVMDVNNVKTTNDTFGHRFGCHLIVSCGKLLPTIFKTSRLFHVGGDEFIAIVIGEDYNNLGDILNEFDQKLRYSTIQFEEHDLIFSVARGYGIAKPKMTYKEVFQMADDRMYENKKEVKKQYNLIIRER